jgi:DNA-directed RNA polymerase subunit K/omega
MMATVSAAVDPAAASALAARRPQNRFRVAVVAFLRARQLQAGARPRVPWNRQKPATLALLEVRAGTISWSVKEAEHA